MALCLTEIILTSSVLPPPEESDKGGNINSQGLITLD